MRTIFIALLSLFILTKVSAQCPPDSGAIKLLSWNTYMLPAAPMFTYQQKRAHGMVAVLKEGQYDLICFQEAFHKGFRKTILEGLKEQYPYQIFAGDKKAFIKPSNGLWILSKQPIHTIKLIEFESKEWPESLFRKGALLFKMDGLKDVYFIATHLQSASGVAKTAARKGQCMEIYKELVEPYTDPNATFVFAGDWNMDAGSAFDNSSLRDFFKVKYPESMPTENTWPSAAFGKKPKTKLFDLILLAGSKQQVASFETGIPDLTYEWKKGRKDLSDHLPVDACFLFSSGGK